MPHTSPGEYRNRCGESPSALNRRALRIIVCAVAIGVVTGCQSSDDDGGRVLDDVGETGDPPASFTATRQQIIEGESTLLRWDSPTAESVTIEPGIGEVEGSGERSVSPTETTEYVLTARRGDAVNAPRLEIEVRPLAAVTLLASTTEGEAPLTVRFTPEVDSSTAINRLYWDFEGDGGDVDGGLGAGSSGFDNLPGFGEYDVVGREFTYTFTEPGTYEPRVRVWDVAGNQAESELTVEVRNAPPVARVRVTPTTGTAPLDASFSVEATDNEGVASFEWDFDGDGDFDETTETGRARHLYESTGEFRPRIRVSDVLGAATVLDPLHLQVNARAETVPIANVTVRPADGPAPLAVSMSASVRSASPIVRWAWDFDGDGRADSDAPNAVEHVYERVGTFYPTLTVTAEDGSVGRDIFVVRVEADHALEIVEPTIDPEAGEETSVALTLRGTSETELVIERAGVGTVRTLAAWDERPSGEYTFTWDGIDESGAVAAPGAYHAVLRYRVDGVEEVLDLRESSGGLTFYPSGWGGRCSYTQTPECGVLTISENPIQPFADNPVAYDFTLPYNARVTAYVTIIGTVDFAPATFFRSRPMAAGDHAIEWFGEGTDGQLLPRRDRQGYLPAIYGVTASDNAIYLSHETRLDGLTVDPPIFYPPLSPAGAARSRLTFDLSREADLLMTVDATDVGTEVYRREIQGVSPGSGITIDWDGRNADGDLVAPGGYRISLVARDAYGQRSLAARAMQRIRY